MNPQPALCRTCKYWGWPSGKWEKQDGSWEPYRDDEPRSCQLISDWPFFVGEHPLREFPSGTPSIAPWAGADGGSLETCPDFGCVLHAGRANG